MTWKIRVRETAEKQITMLDRAIQKRVVKFFEKIGNAQNPRSSGKALRGDKAGLWRYRVGNYRIICSIQDTNEELHVLEVVHRSKAYR